MIGSGKKANGSMSSGIHEEGAGEAGHLSGANVKGMNCGNPFACLLNFEGMMEKLQVDVPFGPNDRFLFGILEFLIGAGRLFGMVANFLYDLADAWIFAAAYVSLCPDPYFT